MNDENDMNNLNHTMENLNEIIHTFHRDIQENVVLKEKISEYGSKLLKESKMELNVSFQK